jgi:hypothetical protein
VEGGKNTHGGGLFGGTDIGLGGFRPHEALHAGSR